VRGKQLEILGYSTSTTPHEVLGEEYRRVLGHASSGAIRLPIERVGLDRIAAAWRRQAGGPHAKIVVVP
jgi:NADPH:quinone reductase-like Zn-dependent oxidoreductase